MPPTPVESLLDLREREALTIDDRLNQSIGGSESVGVGEDLRRTRRSGTSAKWRVGSGEMVGLGTWAMPRIAS